MKRYTLSALIAASSLAATLIHFIIKGYRTDSILITLLFLANIAGLFFILREKSNTEIKRLQGWLFLGRRKTFLFMQVISFATLMYLLWRYVISINVFFTANLACELICFTVFYFDIRIASFLYKKLRVGNRVAVVGYTDTSRDVGYYLSRQNKYSFYGFLNTEENIAAPKDIQHIDALEYCIQQARINNINELYIPFSRNLNGMENRILRLGEKYCIRVKFIGADSVHEILTGYYIDHINDFPVLKKYNEPLLRLKNRIVKRFFDIVISSFMIIFFLSWLIPLLGLLIKIESKGPIFFMQLRSGRDNKSFLCFKFRTMLLNEESDEAQATKNDKRITLVGSLLRKTSLDEFPQFINVFKGDMSIVGPRPHMLRHTMQYSEMIEEYMARLYLKPGVTGWAQVNGYRGETADLFLMQKRVEHDIWYMENWSLWLDISIFFKTILNTLRGEKNAY